VSILKSLSPRRRRGERDAEALGERIPKHHGDEPVGLVEVEADPGEEPRAILVSTILRAAWRGAGTSDSPA